MQRQTQFVDSSIYLYQIRLESNLFHCKGVYIKEIVINELKFEIAFDYQICTKNGDLHFILNESIERLSQFNHYNRKSDSGLQ